MSEEKKKKERAANFSTNEIELLCELVVKHAKIIESKKTDAITWKEKDEEWYKITNEFNSVCNGLPRTMKSLKTKYETLKKDLRKKTARQKLEVFKTGGGPFKDIHYTPAEETILHIISLSVEGLPSRFDDDEELPRKDSQTEECNESGIMKVMHCSKESDTCDISEDGEEIIYIQTGEDPTGNLMNNQVAEAAEHSPILSQVDTNQPSTSRWSKWTPGELKRPLPKGLQGNRKRKVISRPEAAEKVSLLATSKTALLELQQQSVREDIDFKRKEHHLRIKKYETELECATLEVEIKQKEKEIKIATLKKISNTSFMNM